LAKFDISDNSLYAAGAKLLAEALSGNQIMTELNIASNNLGEASYGIWDMSVTALVNTIRDMRALRSLHVGNNTIPEKELREIMGIVMHMDSMKVLCEVPFKDKTLTGLDVSGKNLGTEGALVVAEYLDGNEALTSLNISDNHLCDISAWMKPPRQSLKVGHLVDGKRIVKIFSDGDIKVQDLSGVVALARAIKDMGALSTLIFGGDTYSNASTNWEDVTPAPATLEVGMTEADFSNTNLGPGGAIIISAWISHYNGALSVLSLKANKLATKEAGQLLAKMLKGNSVLKEIDVSSNVGFYGDDGPGFAQELAVGIKDNRTLMSLDISDNNLTDYGTDMSGTPREHVFGLLI
jgi:Ran GTPase-activating protein (RanGAP) involved in mRNA processing and transport